MSIIEYIGSIGGVGAVLAVLLFLCYRHLVNQMRQDRKYMEDRQADLIHNYHEAISENTKILAENAKIQTELFTWLKAKNGNRS